MALIILLKMAALKRIKLATTANVAFYIYIGLLN